MKTHMTTALSLPLLKEEQDSAGELVVSQGDFEIQPQLQLLPTGLTALKLQWCQHSTAGVVVIPSIDFPLPPSLPSSLTGVNGEKVSCLSQGPRRRRLPTRPEFT